MRDQRDCSSPSAPRTRRSAPVLSNAFTASFLERLRHLEEPAGLPGAGLCGPWEVEEVGAGYWAVVRRDEPLGAGGRAFAVYRERGPALCTAAVLPALGTENVLRLGEHRKRLGVPLHAGHRHLGHLAHPEPALLPLLHAATVLATRPEALALLLEAGGREMLAMLGRVLARRVGGGGGG